MKNTIKLFLTGLIFSTSLTSHATLLTADTIASSTVVDFSTQPTVTNQMGPIQIGTLVGEDITATSTTADLSTNFDGWGLGSNGNWGSPQTYISAQSAAPMLIAFNDGPVSEVGGIMNDFPGGGDLTITAFDAGMAVLETYNVTNLANISTPGGNNAGEFRGISRPTNDIAFFQIEGESPVLDDLTFARNGVQTEAVPTLSQWSLILLTLMLGYIGFSSRKKHFRF